MDIGDIPIVISVQNIRGGWYAVLTIEGEDTVRGPFGTKVIASLAAEVLRDDLQNECPEANITLETGWEG